jgi:hypothetical protein
MREGQSPTLQEPSQSSGQQNGPTGPGTQRLEALEIASGHVFGFEPEPALPSTQLSPLAALERLVEDAVRSRPCLVSFSGGLDSSLVLAVAARVARRDGLPDPVPITWRFRDAPQAEESEWQERVVKELKIHDWERLTADADELDLVGPVSRRVLDSHGVVYPSNAFLHEPLLSRASGGTLLTGIGGDQVLGLWRSRLLADLFARRRRASLRDPLRVARALAPPRARLLFKRSHLDPLPWLRPIALHETVRRHELQLASEPVWWPGHVRWQLRRRDVILGPMPGNRSGSASCQPSARSCVRGSSSVSRRPVWIRRPTADHTRPVR